jgi:hypothetical protein
MLYFFNFIEIIIMSKQKMSLGIQFKYFLRIIFYNLLLFTSLSCLPASGQSDTAKKNKGNNSIRIDNFAMFSGDEPLEATMNFDLLSYIRKNLNGASLDGFLTFHLSETDSIRKKIKLKARGSSRYDNCGFPPMEINFKEPVAAYPDSLRVNKIKLVTHCQTGNINNVYVLKEYLVYKLFNLISDSSYRVRLVRMKYTDSNNKRKPLTQYGFFIEPDAVLAKRLSSAVNKTRNLTQRNILPDVMDKITIFNYMIANWDWNIPNLQNVILLKYPNSGNSSLQVAVPYDFDLSGFVNVDYAILPPEYGLTSKRDRIFLGICRTEKEYQKVLVYYLTKKDEFYKTINDFPYLSIKEKKDLTGFLNQFYSQLETSSGQDHLIKYFMSICKHIQ